MSSAPPVESHSSLSRISAHIHRLISGHKGGSIFVLLIMIYALGASDRLSRASSNHHFAYLAESFLSGQLHLKRSPPHGNDWASYEILRLAPSAQSAIEQTLSRPIDDLKGVFLPKEGQKRWPRRFQTLRGEQVVIKRGEMISKTRRHYVSFPPMPAILMLPLVAIFGLATSDVWFTIFFGALNGLIAFTLFKRVIQWRIQWRESRPLIIAQSETSDHLQVLSDHQVSGEALWLTLSLCLGTAHLWCAVRGEVWFTALILGVTFQLLFFRWAWQLRRPLLAGLAYACAFSTRASLITLGLFAYLQLFSTGGKYKFDERLRRLGVFTIPPLIIGLSLLYYNHVRFERWYEFGHSYLAGGQLKRIAEYGLFHPIFLQKNLIAAFALLPSLSLSPLLFTYSWHGMALQFSSPHLLMSLLPNLSAKGPKIKSRESMRLGLGVVSLSTLGLLLFYQNTGWVQYSWRFALDFIPAVTLFIATTAQAKGKLYKSLTLWGVFINMGGAIIFGRSSVWWVGVNLPQLLPH